MIFMVKNLVGKPVTANLPNLEQPMNRLGDQSKEEKAERKIRNSRTENWAHFGRTR